MDKDIVLTIFAGTLLFLLLASFIIAFWMIYKRRRKEHVQEKEQMKVLFEQELLKSHLEIREQTLKNISQEIHDNIGQVLSLVKLNIGTMDITFPVAWKEKQDDSKYLLGKVIQDLRDLSRSMDTDFIVEKGLYHAIEHEIELIRKTGIYKVELLAEGDNCRMEPRKELILFRIFQEIINNILKHAMADNINIRMLCETTSFTLEVADNGTGFDVGSLFDGNNYKGGLGLKNMQKRSLLIGGHFDIRSNMPGGTVISISLLL
jgi:signal transduction histidine kinase